MITYNIFTDYDKIMFIFFAVLYFIFGIFIGSFLNVCIFRIPKKETVVTTSSHCMNCGKKLAWYDLFPILSWLILKGKCRYCSKKISIRYPVVELLNGIIWLLIYIKFNGVNFYSVMYCIMSSFMIVLSFIDIDEGIVPDKILILFLILCIPIVIYDKTNWVSHIIGFFIVSFPFLIIACITNGMGGGDIKLYAVLGLFLGLKLILVSAIMCCIVASIFGLIIMLIGKGNKKTALRLVPFIFTGVLISIFFGEYIVKWYMGFFIV